MSGGEFGMLVLETVLKIRREFASGKALKAIARDLRLSRKVVRKAIREPDAEFAYLSPGGAAIAEAGAVPGQSR